MQRKAQRRTPERILEISLRLFNDFGEHNVTTAVIADELNISPGNLYYHFHGKDQILEALFARFEREMEGILSAPTRRPVDVEDIWLFVHLLFEAIWRYRFLYRDLSDLLSRNRVLETHFKRIVEHKQRTARALCEGLVAQGRMRAQAHELEVLATNIGALSTCWLSYEYVRNPRHMIESQVLARGTYQVMCMIAPYLVDAGRSLFDRLAREYLEHR